MHNDSVNEWGSLFFVWSMSKCGFGLSKPYLKKEKRAPHRYEWVHRRAVGPGGGFKERRGITHMLLEG